jgi:DNA-binding response OmpR family regulator
LTQPSALESQWPLMTDNAKIMVLVADDEPSTRALVTGHLKRRGYKVLEASDGDEAWELAHEHLPDLVVLDVMMPGMSGWEVCRKIREAVSLAHTGVVMLTGIGENLNEMTSPLYGADAYVDKPFEFSVLDTKIQETLARRHAGVVGRDDGATPARAEKKPVKKATEAPAKKRAAKKAAKKPAAKPAKKKTTARKAPKKKAAPKRRAPKKPAKKRPVKKAGAKRKAKARAAPKRAAKAARGVKKAKRRSKKA